MANTGIIELSNPGFRVEAQINDRTVSLKIHDLTSNFSFTDQPYLYRAGRQEKDHVAIYEGLESASIDVQEMEMVIRGKLAGLDLEHHLRLPKDKPYLEEQIVLCNHTREGICLVDFACSAQHLITNSLGKPAQGLSADRFQAIPFYHRPTDPSWSDNDFDIAYLLSHTGSEMRVNELAALPQGHGWTPSNRHLSEGWAWQHGEHTLGIFKFNQEYLEFSVLATEATPAGVCLRFGGAGMLEDEPSCLRNIQPGQEIRMGKTRFETVQGDYTEANYALASYAFRCFLDENGCRFPRGYNPPVHWNELYDNAEWSLGSPGRPAGPRMTRPLTYTKELILEEAAKARDYHCEALYLDPGWDSDFATFRWGEAWLGNRKDFIEQLRQQFGLSLSLHTPLATWMSMDGRAVETWPEAALRMDPKGNIIPGSICLGARQYLDEAEKRLLENCSDGVSFLMFDGNWWNGGCWNPEHGHTVPYTKEDHCRANLDLARRIHAHYPKVLIEMHDMIAGGSVLRYTPVYYKYGLPGSYDENWGFELMWQPMEDILSGRARSLYYYNLGCNVPAYLHIDLRDDNDHLLVFWWYASTCRHLGIGGTHEDPRIAQAHRLAMLRYRQLDRFYKRGDFYGFGEEVHVHALPEENAFVVNLFNLSGETRQVGAEIPIEAIGLKRDYWYTNPAGGSFDGEMGLFRIQRRMEPWSAQVAEAHILKGA